MIEIKVETNARELAKQLGEFAEKQIPFATARALTDTAQVARDKVRETLGKHFQLRARSRMERGITIQRAEKRDWPKPFALVASRDEFMAPHVTGGVKKAQKGARHVVIPARWIQKSGRTSTGKIPKSLKPRVVRERKGTIVTKDPVSPERQAIQRRVEGTRSKARTRKLQLVHLMRRSVKIRRTWPFDTIVQGAAKEAYGKAFEQRLREGVASAKARVKAPAPLA